MTTTTAAARRLAALRKTHGGPPRKPTPCARCGAQCDSARGARAHCPRAAGSVSRRAVRGKR